MGDKQILSSEFLEFMIDSGALLFGDFTLKSGRKSPYFINTGEYKTGTQLSRLGEFYAKLIENSVRPEAETGSVGEKIGDGGRVALNNAIKAKFNVMFGPAYKGIPLVTAASIKLAANGLDIPVSYNRKETKDHGEAGRLLGYTPKNGDKIAIIEDVTTAGTSVRETIDLLGQMNIDAQITALYISVDRMEKGTGETSAIVQLSRDYNIDVYAIATARDIVRFLKNPESGGAKVHNAAYYAEQMENYLNEYGSCI